VRTRLETTQRNAVRGRTPARRFSLALWSLILASFAQRMKAALETALATNTQAGLVSIQIDGQAVTYNRKDARDEYEFWSRRVARENGARPNVATIRLDKAF